VEVVAGGTLPAARSPWYSRGVSENARPRTDLVRVFDPDAFERATVAATRCDFERLLLLQPHVPVLGLWRAGDSFLAELPQDVDSTTLATAEGEPLAAWLKRTRQWFARELVFSSEVPPDASRVPGRDAVALACLDVEAPPDRLAEDLDFGIGLPRDFPPFLIAPGGDPRLRTTTCPSRDKLMQAIRVGTR
jgi:hypothetical protein